MKIVEGSVLKGDGSPIGLDQISIQPRCELGRIADGCGERNDLRVRFNVPESRKVDLKRGPPCTIVHQMEFIGHDTAEVSDKFSAMAKQGIQFFRGADENVAVIDVLGFGRCVADA